MKKNIYLSLLILLLLSGCAKEKKDEITISVAVSLIDGIEEIATQYTKDTGIDVQINTGGSGSLRRQVEQGAPVDFIFLASKADIDKLEEKKLVEKTNDLLKNKIVILGHKEIESLEEVKGLIALGDPEFVPSGRYGKETFIKLGLWDKVSKNLLLTRDARSSLTYVMRGEVDFAVVYNTDVLDVKDKHIYVIEDNLHSPIVYSAGVGCKSSGGEKFSDYLKKNIDIFEKYGFKVK